MVTTTSITAVSVSMRSAQSTLRLPEVMKLKTGMRASCSPKPTSKNAIQDSTQVNSSSEVVTISAARDPAAGGSVACSSSCEGWMTACSSCGDGAARGRSSGTSGAAWSSAPGDGFAPG